MANSYVDCDRNILCIDTIRCRYISSEVNSDFIYIANNQTTGVLHIATAPTRSSAINIGTGNNSTMPINIATVQNFTGSVNIGTGVNSSGPINIGSSSSTTQLITFNRPIRTQAIGPSGTSDSFDIAPSQTTGVLNIGTGIRTTTGIINIGTGVTSVGHIYIGSTGSANQTITFNRPILTQSIESLAVNTNLQICNNQTTGNIIIGDNQTTGIISIG